MKYFRWLKYASWLVLPILVGYAVRELPLNEILDALLQLEISQILVLILVNAVISVGFSARWWLFLRAQGHRVAYLPLALYRTAAFSLSYFTPGPQFGGEPLQVHLLRSRESIPSPSAIASVSLDKIFEISINFLFLSAGLFVILTEGILIVVEPAYLVVLIVLWVILPSVYLFALWVGKRPLSLLVGRLPDPIQRLKNIQKVSTLVMGIEVQVASLLKKRPVTILWALLVSVLIWSSILGEYWLMLYFLGVQVNLPQAVIALTAARMAFLTPLPGGIGILEASQVLAMQALGYDPALGISISLLIRVRDVLVGLIGFGVIALYSRKNSTLSQPGQIGD